MKELQFHRFTELFLKAEKPLFICSPNFEARSTSTLLTLASLDGFDPIQVLQLNIHSLTERSEILERLRSQQVGIASQVQIAKEQNWQIRRIRYPDRFSAPHLKRILDACTDSEYSDIALDISALPHRVGVNATKVLSAASRERGFNLFLTYAWAKSYPHGRYPTSVGYLQRTFLDAPFESELLPASGMRAIVFLGHQGFDAQNFVDHLPSDTIIDVFAFLNREDILYSYQVLRSNVTVLRDPRTRVHYFVTIESGHKQLIDLIGEIAKQPPTALFIATFGPKPMHISSVYALEAFEQRTASASVEKDLVTMSTHFYGSVYSLSSKNISVYQCS